METVDVHEVSRYAWECPKCGEWNEQDDSPEYEDCIVCDSCKEEFEANVQQ